MSLEAHATAAGAGHPEAELPAGEPVNLAETIVIKEENVFVVSARDGSLPVGESHPLGVYRDDCRFLSGHQLRVNGIAPRLLVASAAAGSEAVHELTNPALPLDGGRVLPLQSLQIRLDRVISGEREVEERLLVHSYDPERLELSVELQLAADFEPMLAVRGIAGTGPRRPAEITGLSRGVRFSLLGRDGMHRATTVRADRACEPGAAPGAVRFELALAPAGEATIVLRYELYEGEEPPPRAAGPSRSHRAPPTPGEWLAERTTIETDDQLFNRVLRRALLDIRMLHSRRGADGYYAAGVPWYATLFGRDSLITATQMLGFDPPMAAETLRVLAGLIGERDDREHDEEPGKVLHELRIGEIARLGLSPLARYYGTVDATPLFLCLLGEHADWAGDLALFHELRPQVEAMLGWMDGPGDRDGDGLLEYCRRTPAGLRNQGWKDSDEGVLDEYGVPLEPPVALVEAQGYMLRAKRRVAALFASAGQEDRARALLAEAGALRDRLERFWLPGRGYNPVGYHLGTVWPHDTAMTAVGLRKFGFDEDFTEIFEAMLETAAASAAYRLPELFAGFSRTEFETPVPYPVACQPQAWAAGSIPFLLLAGLGIVPDGLRGRLRIRRPSLPGWLNQARVRNLRIAGSRVDLTFERTASGAVALAEAQVRGDVDVVLEIRGSRAPTSSGY